jgi:hypothetical protein
VLSARGEPADRVAAAAQPYALVDPHRNVLAAQLPIPLLHLPSARRGDAVSSPRAPVSTPTLPFTDGPLPRPTRSGAKTQRGVWKSARGFRVAQGGSDQCRSGPIKEMKPPRRMHPMERQKLLFAGLLGSGAVTARESRSLSRPRTTPADAAALSAPPPPPPSARVRRRMTDGHNHL